MVNLLLVCDCSRKNQTNVFLNSFKQIKWLMMKNIVKSWKLTHAWEKYLPKNKKKYLPIEWKSNSMFCAFCAKVTFRFSCLYLANRWKFHIKLISQWHQGQWLQYQYDHLSVGATLQSWCVTSMLSYEILLLWLWIGLNPWFKEN